MAIADVAARVGQLLRMLGSDRDGEALAAARALNRTLKSAGADLHDLAQLVEKPPRQVERVVYRDRPSCDPTTWHELATWCSEHDAGRLAAHERTFVFDMANRLMFDGEPSEKQANWLRSLYAKLRRTQ